MNILQYAFSVLCVFTFFILISAHGNVKLLISLPYPTVHTPCCLLGYHSGAMPPFAELYCKGRLASAAFVATVSKGAALVCIRDLDLIKKGDIAMKRIKIKCPYYGSQAFLRPASAVRRHAQPGEEVYVCARYPTCDAYVSTHRETRLPMGTLANSSLRN